MIFSRLPSAVATVAGADVQGDVLRGKLIAVRLNEKCADASFFLNGALQSREKWPGFPHR